MMRNNFPKRPLAILFAIRAVENYMYVRSIIENLARRGHVIEVIFDKRYSSSDLGYLKGLRVDNVRYGWAQIDGSYWRKIFYNCQDILSWRRYFKVWGQSEFYKDRWTIYLPVVIRFAVKFAILRKIILSNFSARIFRLIINATPVASQIIEHIWQFGPDVVAATPANIPFSSCDQEYLRAAKKLSIPTVVPVFSWDNLTTKGLFHVVPDLLLVWNKQQKKEAKIHQGIESKKTEICGAYFFDHWFERRRPASRESFCKAFGLDFKKPILFYLGSSDSLVGDERWLVEKVRDNLNQSSLAKVQIIVRPHPFKNAFRGFSKKGVLVMPKKNTWPDKKDSIDLYYDCLYHSFAVVGVNTSGFCDAAILDKPIIAIFAEKYRKTQIDTEHFRQLIENKVCDLVSLQRIGGSVKAILSGKDKHKLARRKFVKNFVRPLGISVNAGEVAAREIERASL